MKRNYLHELFYLSIIMLFTTAILSAGPKDWNQWRGPNRDGIARQKMNLAENWGEDGPALLWLNEEIPSNADGGYSSVSIADGRGYLYVNWKHREPIEYRILTEEGMKNLGWQKEKMPVQLQEQVESLRSSQKFKDMNRKERQDFAKQWLEDNLDDGLEVKFKNIINKRLNMGNRAASWEVLAKLEAIIDRKFENQEALDKWYEENEIPKDVRNRLISIIPRTLDSSRDAVVCFDLADGSIIWTKKFDEQEAYDWGTSSTPAVAGGNVYAVGSSKLYCLDAENGDEKWEVALNEKEVSSSPLVIEGVVVVLAGNLKGYDVQSGALKWVAQDIRGKNPSPALWKSGDKTYILCNGWTMGLVDPVDGSVLWTVQSGGNATAAIAGDTAVVLGMNDKTGLVAWDLSVTGAVEKWRIPMKDRGSTPVILDNHIYVVASNHITCVSLDEGRISWQVKFANEIASPIVADGKIFAHVLKGRKLFMINPDPERFDLLSEARMKISTVVSPVIQDGKLYLRVKEGLACYDLSVQPSEEFVFSE